MDPKVNVANSFVIDPDDSEKIYLLGSKIIGNSEQMMLSVSTDSGVTWPTLIPVTSAWNITSPGAFRMAPSDHSIWYATGSTRDGAYNKHALLKRSTDGGQTWTDAVGNIPSNYALGDLWIAPDDSNYLVVEVEHSYNDKRIYYSVNGGAHWVEAAGFPGQNSVNNFVYHPSTDVLYVTGYDNGVYESSDRGQTWSLLGSGLNANALGLTSDLKNGYLYACTWGQCICRLDVDPVSLWSQYPEVSQPTGGSVDFELQAGSVNQNRSYLLLVGATGVSPGFPLPGGNVTVPLNWDAVTNITLGLANTPMFANFMGQLDSNGAAGAQFMTGPLPAGVLGLRLYFAYFCDYPFDYASNPVSLIIVD